MLTPLSTLTSSSRSGKALGICAAAVKEVMGKDGRMKKVRRRVQVDAHATPLAKKVDTQVVDIRHVLWLSLLLLSSSFEP